MIQRLFGVSMALDGEGDLPGDARKRCASETQAALVDLRAALQRPLGRAPRATQTTLREEVKRLARMYPELGLTLERGADDEVPAALEPLAQSVLAEAVRNAHKHANPDQGRGPGQPARRRVRRWRSPTTASTGASGGPGWACGWPRSRH